MTPARKNRSLPAFDADVIIVGGGLAGLSLACLLGRADISVICIDREPIPKTQAATFDLRTTAVSYGSHLLLQEAGIWAGLSAQACPILDIRILDGDSPVLLNFLSRDVADRPFGWIVNNLDLRQALHKKVGSLKTVRHLAPASVQAFKIEEDAASVTLEDGTSLKSRLIVGADGKKSYVRKFIKAPLHGWMYGQAAIVCVVAHEHAHRNVAIEHFRPEGPFAVLPMGDAPDGSHRSSLVWTVEGDGRAELNYDPDTFNAALAARFPEYYGTVWASGPKAAWPLGLQHVHSYTGPRMALVAEAAHVLHPIAGQGLNMGLRDIAELSSLIIEARQDHGDAGNPVLLRTYQRRRHFDNMAMLAATDGLTRLFSNRLAAVEPLRRLGARLVQAVPPARRFFMRQAMGTAGLVPPLMKKDQFRG